MNDDGTVYPFDPFADHQQLPPLDQEIITFARAADHRHRTARAAHYRSQSLQLEAEYTLIYHLEVLWNAVKTLLRTYARLGIGVRVDEDDLEYEDDLAWMGAKTEIGAAGEEVRRRIGLVPDTATKSSSRGNSASSKPGSSKPGSSKAGSIKAASTKSGSSSMSPGVSSESGEILMQRLRVGGASDEQLRSRLKIIIRLYDTMIRAKKGGTNWITEKAVLRSSVYAIVFEGFAEYPLWHEDREFVDQLSEVVDGFVDNDR